MSPSKRSKNFAKELGGIGRRGAVTETEDIACLVQDTLSEYGRIDAVVKSEASQCSLHPTPQAYMIGQNILVDGGMNRAVR